MTGAAISPMLPRRLVHVQYPNANNVLTKMYTSEAHMCAARPRRKEEARAINVSTDRLSYLLVFPLNIEQRGNCSRVTLLPNSRILSSVIL